MKYSSKDIALEQSGIFRNYSQIYYINFLQGTIDTLKSWFPNSSKFDYSKMVAYTPVIGNPSLEKITTEYDSWLSWGEPQDNGNFFGPKEKQFIMEFYISYLTNLKKRQNENYSEQKAKKAYSENNYTFNQYLVDFVMKQNGYMN